jgi:hypothetical protein
VDGCSVGRYPSPKSERLCRLFNQHAKTLSDTRCAVLPCPAYERCVGLSITKVVRERLRTDDSGIDLRNAAAETKGRRVDHEIEVTSIQKRTELVVATASISDQRARALDRSIGDDEFGRVAFLQGSEDAAGGAAGAENEYTMIVHFDTESREICHETRAIGVVAAYTTVFEFD